MDFVTVLWEVLIDMLESSIYTFLFFQCLPLKGRYEKHPVTTFLLITVFETLLTCLCNFTNIAFIPTQLLLFGADFLLILTIFQNTLPKKLFTAILPSCISILADKLTFLIGGFLFSTTLDAFDVSGSHRFYSTFMYLVICLFSSLLFAWITKSDIYLTTPLCLSTYVIIILGIICNNLFLDIIVTAGHRFISHDTLLRLQFISIGFLIIFLFLIVLIQQIGHTYEKNLTLEQKLHQEQTNKTQLELSTQSMKNIRSWKHDYKNHMVTITALAKKERCTELLDYLNRLQENLPEYFTSISSGNTAIDAIVTNKLQLARQFEIPFTHSIMLAGICPLSDLDITAVLGNLLDNSLDACRKLSEHHSETSPYIQLSIKPFRDMLQIQIVNSSDGHYQLADNHSLRTTKKDSTLHGYGMKHVQEIVQTANGIMKIQPESERFTVNILIPCSNSEE